MNAFFERILLYRIQKLRDPKAFEVMYKEYQAQIYRFVSQKLPEAGIAEDITNETFLKVWRYLQDDEPIEHFQALLFRIARIGVADYYRNREVSSLTLEEVGVETFADKRDPLRALDLVLDEARVKEALGKLKESYREAITLRYFEGLSIEEIALALEKSPGTVRVLIHRAVGALEKFFQT